MIYLRLWSEHVQHLDSVLYSIRESGLYLNANKCQFGVEETSFVVFPISAEGIDTDAKKIEAIVSLPVLQSVGEVHLFLGLAGYYHSFVELSADRSAALHGLVNACIETSKASFRWEATHQEQFDSLKYTLSFTPVLVTMAANKEFILHTDASDTMIGMVFAQM
jgi:hypothetical protein